MVANMLPWRECYDCMDVVHSPVADSVLPHTLCKCTVWGVRCEENIRIWCAALAAFLVVTVHSIALLSVCMHVRKCINMAWSSV